MRMENKRFISKNNIGKTILEDDEAGIFIIDTNEKSSLKKLGLNEYQLLDYSNDGRIILLKSKEWVAKTNTNRNWLTALDTETNKELFKTNNFLAYQSIIDNTSKKFLLEYYNGLCVLDIYTGEIVFKKNKIDKSIYNADIHYKSNTILIPTEKKSILTFDFNTNKLEEIKIKKIGPSSWIKFDKSQNTVLISDELNSLHCFNYKSYDNPIWTIDFSKFENNNRIWCYKIMTTESNLGCIQGFTPSPSQNPYCGGILYIFDLLEGKILEQFDYSKINQNVIADFENDKIILDDLSAFSLRDKKIIKTEFVDLIN